MCAALGKLSHILQHTLLTGLLISDCRQEDSNNVPAVEELKLKLALTSAPHMAEFAVYERRVC